MTSIYAKKACKNPENMQKHIKDLLREKAEKLEA